tara:strand:+ start:10849 stop:11739 length:891 start_codon:yes stop_codon:yes gene_type:complete
LLDKHGKSLKVSTYKVENQFVKMTKFGIWFFGLMAVISLVSAFLPNDDGVLKLASVLVMLVCTIILGGFAYYVYLTFRNFPSCSISIDNDGLWYAEQGKADGLIEWREICSIREKPKLQKLKLYNYEGKRLIDIHYQLQSFNELRNILAEKVAVNYLSIHEPIFKKGIGHHVFNIFVISGFIALAFYGYFHFSTLLFWSVVFIVAACLHEYLSGYHKVYIKDGYLRAKSHLRSKSYDMENVTEVVMLDEFDKGSRIPNVGVYCGNESGFKIPSLGSSAIEIYIILKNIIMDKKKGS